jgi:hypothetical protein
MIKLLLGILLMSQAHAAVNTTSDLDTVLEPYWFVLKTSNYRMTQEFTAAQTGTLTSVKLNIQRDPSLSSLGALTVRIFTNNASGNPGSAKGSQINVNVSSIPDGADMDTSFFGCSPIMEECAASLVDYPLILTTVTGLNAPVVAGQKYHIVIGSNSTYKANNGSVFVSHDRKDIRLNAGVTPPSAPFAKYWDSSLNSWVSTTVNTTQGMKIVKEININY